MDTEQPFPVGALNSLFVTFLGLPPAKPYENRSTQPSMRPGADGGFSTLPTIWE